MFASRPRWGAPKVPKYPRCRCAKQRGSQFRREEEERKNHRPEDAGQPTQTLSWTTSLINLAVWSSRHSAPFRFVTRPPTRGNKQWTQRWPRNRQCRAARDPGFPHAGSWWRLRGDGMYFCLLSKGCARHHSWRSRRPSSHLEPEIAQSKPGPHFFSAESSPSTVQKHGNGQPVSRTRS